MNDNIKLEVAIEIMASKIAKTSKQGYDINSNEMKLLLEEKEKISKQIDECKTYDQVIAHVANQRISIDLDDGVKVNYNKFQGIEVLIGNGKKNLKANLLFKAQI